MGPTTSIPIASEILLSLGNIKEAAKQATKDAAVLRKEIEAAAKEGKLVDAAQIQRLRKAEAIGSLVKDMKREERRVHDLEKSMKLVKTLESSNTIRDIATGNFDVADVAGLLDKHAAKMAAKVASRFGAADLAGLFKKALPPLAIVGMIKEAADYIMETNDNQRKINQDVNNAITLGEIGPNSVRYMDRMSGKLKFPGFSTYYTDQAKEVLSGSAELGSALEKNQSFRNNIDLYMKEYHSKTGDFIGGAGKRLGLNNVAAGWEKLFGKTKIDFSGFSEKLEDRIVDSEREKGRVLTPEERATLAKDVMLSYTKDPHVIEFLKDKLQKDQGFADKIAAKALREKPVADIYKERESAKIVEESFQLAHMGWFGSQSD